MSFSANMKLLGDYDAESIGKSAEFKDDAVKDTINAKLEGGEIVLHPKIYSDPDMQPALMAIFNKMLENGQNPLSAIAGAPSDLGGQFDPMAMGAMGDPSNPQHFFFKSIFRAIKKLARNPIVRTVVTIGASAINPALGAAVSGAMTKAAGGSWGQALGSAAGTYLGGKIMGGTTPKGVEPSFGSYGSVVNPTTGLSTGVPNAVGNSLSSVASNSSSMFSGLADTALSGIGSLPNAISGTILNANLGSMIGSNLGGSVGTMVGGAIDPPAIPQQMLVNAGVGQPIQPNMMPSSSNLNLGLGNSVANAMYKGSNIGPVAYASGLASGAYQGGSDLGRSWSDMLPSGVSYVRQLKNRQGDREEQKVGTFGSYVDNADRRFSLNSNLGQGVLYY